MAGLSRTVRRQRVLLAAALVAAVLAGGGLVASMSVKSPAQQALETKPPAATVLTAPVVLQVLTNTVTVRGTVEAGGGINITPAAGGGASAGGGGSGSLVVSKLYTKAGDQIKAGQVLVEVSGRPIIALAGAVPAYRDLKPGMDGPDVAQFQAALTALGYSCSPDASGHFGPGTKDAVTAFYTHLGYSVPTTGGPNDTGDATALQGAADAVTEAQRTVTADAGILDKATKALAAAKTAARTAAAATTSAGPPTSNGSGPGTDGNATAGETAVQSATDAQSTAQISYDDAVQDLAKAQRAEAELTAATGAMLPASEVVFLPRFPIRLAALNATLGGAVTAPLLTLQSGDLVVASVLQPGQNTIVKTGLKVQLDAEAMGDQQATGAVTMVGSLSDGAADTTDSSQTGGGTGGSASGQNAGQSGGQSSGDGQQAQQTPGYPMTVTPDAPLPAAWAGQNVRVTITDAATPTAVLTVPLSAVSTGTDGQDSVTIVAADGTAHRVIVTAGTSADGDVQVTPAAANALRQGDQVVVGQAQQ